MKWLRKLIKFCWRCDGRGYTIERGERIPRSELSPSAWADEMVNGGFTYRGIKTECPKCNGTGEKP